MYKAKFSHQKNILSKPNQKSIEGIYPIRLKFNNEALICVRQGRALTGYKYVPENSTWLNHWSEFVFEQEGNYDRNKYPWMVVDKIKPDRDVIIIKHVDGIRFYQPNLNKPGLELLKEDGHFHNVYGNTLLWGRFYPDPNEIGVMSRNPPNEMKFYVIAEDSVWSNTTYPVFPVDIDTISTSPLKSAEKTYLTNLNHGGQKIFVLRSSIGLEIYRFNKDYLLEKLFATPLRNKPEDRLFFANLTEQSYQDILHLNNSGLYMYQYNNENKNYVFYNHHTDTEINKYNESLRIVDLNNDGREDILFTGIHGLKALTFEPSVQEWKTLLSANDLNALQRYSKIVGILPPMPPHIQEQSIFIQDSQGYLQWAKIEQTNRKPDEENIISPVQAEETVPTYNSLAIRENAVIPEKITRSKLSEHLHLRWTKQWSDNFLKHAVNLGSGHVQFSMPLLDVSATTQWRFQLALSYNSQAQVSDFLGIGWTLPIADDFIFVDHRGSIYPEDYQYYLMAKGRPQRLKLINTQDKVKNFQIADHTDEDITIKYHMTAERWVVEGAEEHTMYGKANVSGANDIIQMSLTWSNWRNFGSRMDQLQPLVIGWYLNARITKDRQQTLFYQYDKDDVSLPNGKTYTAAIRLKAITDNQEMKVTFSYTTKANNEYTKQNPINEKGIIEFPIALVNKHYLQQYTLFTADYQQTIKFVYEINDGKRLLSSVQQVLPSTHETIMLFNYQNLFGKQILTSCKTSRDFKLNFQYNKMSTVSSGFAHPIKFPIGEKTKVSYGPDFAVMTDRNLNLKGKINVRIMNREMTKTDVHGTIDIMEDSSIEDYILQSYSNSFAIILNTEQTKSLYLFNRKTEEWSKEPKIYRYDKKAVVKLGKSIIAVSESDQYSVKIFECTRAQSEWNETKFNVTQKVTHFALHNRFVAGYDNAQLTLFYRDSNFHWQKRILQSNLGNLHHIVDRFDLGHDLKDEWKEVINQSSLQIINNFIVLSYMEVTDNWICSHVELFLLDNQYRIANKQTFQFQRERIYNLFEDFKYDKSTYKLRYKNNNGLYKLYIESASGKVTKNVDEIRNKNIRADKRRELLKYLNDGEGWNKHFRSKILIDWKLYETQISQEGIYCGQDTLLRFTGSAWQKESQPPVGTIRLGKKFILETIDEKKTIYKLYKQDKNQNKQGQPLKELQLKSLGQLVNRYPSYIAYQNNDNVNVVTFKDDTTLGKTYTYQNEELLLQSDWKNLLTVKNITSAIEHMQPMEFFIRPTSEFVIPEAQIFVNKLTQADGNIERFTGYERSMNNNLEMSTISEKITIIPGANKSLYGWSEITRVYNINSGNITKIEQHFDNNGKEVLVPAEIPSHDDEPVGPKKSKKTNPMLLFDHSGKLIISNFSPYSMEDDMVEYYGFESYETENDIKTSWKTSGTNIIKGSFSFTGENYLELNKATFLEKNFEPRNQDIVYLAASWIRCSTPLAVNSQAPYFKAIIRTTNGQKIITLMSEVKHQYGDWYYLELLIDFEIVKQIYKEYFIYFDATLAKNNSTIALPNSDAVKFTITLRFETNSEQTADIDHIRFTPLNHYFEASVFHSLTKKQTALIQTNGFVTRTIYNRLYQEIASLQEDGQIANFESSSQSGYLAGRSKEGYDQQRVSRLIIEPENGFYETFDAYSLQSRWKLDSATAWRVAPGQLWHKHPEKHRIQADARLFDNATAAVRFYFALETKHSSLNLLWNNGINLKIIREQNSSAFIFGQKNPSIQKLPLTGEVIVMLDQNYMWVWLDGVLLYDKKLPSLSTTPWSSFSMEVNDQVLVEDFFVMNQPHLQIEYFNAFGEKNQVIQLEDALNAQVTETLYDEIGREAITTKTTRIRRDNNLPLLAYRSNFVENKNPASNDSVWQTGKLYGEVVQLNPDDRGFPYKRVRYARSPLNEEDALGLPGPEFAVSGPYATKKSQDSGLAFLSNLFPNRNGFRQKVVEAPNGTKKVAVFDKLKNQVALYVHVPSFNHLLSIFEYDTENRLVKILPPLYNEKVNTVLKLTPWQSGEKHLSAAEKEWQQLLSTRFTYDDNGNLVRKVTADTGTTEYIYNSAGQKRFMVSLGKDSRTNQIVYFDYDAQGQTSRTGHITMPLSLQTLREHLESPYLPYAQDYQQFDYADRHPNPIIRGRFKQFITYNDDDEPLIEKLQFDAKEQIVAKDLVFEMVNDAFTEVKKKYIGKNLHSLTYPSMASDQNLQLIHHYNRLGQLVSIGTTKNPTLFTFTYNADGQLTSEHHHSTISHNFIRNYNYNSPGFLEKISDPFLTEHITYTKNGYGHGCFGDGMIMKTAFNAAWPLNADGRWFQIKENDFMFNHSALCIRALKRTGYLSENGQSMKLFVRELEIAFPLECDGNIGRHITKLIAEKQMPRYYGHSFAYGNHQELVKAKYFSDELESETGPLQPDTFYKEISGVTEEQSKHIWKLLTKSKYVITDKQRNDLNTEIGKREKSFLLDKDLWNDLKLLDEHYILYTEPIKRLIIKTVCKRLHLSLKEFQDIFLHWEGTDQTSTIIEINVKKEKARKIGNMLFEKSYLSTNTTTASQVLDPNFTLILKEYAAIMPEIVQVLSQHFAYSLGETAFDLESYNIDANGNHHLFWNGFNRYELTYRNATNQVDSVKLHSFDTTAADDLLPSTFTGKTFPMTHDAQGNVIQALHKGIQSIEYHPVSQRTTRIQMVDGKSLRFYYDAQGERILKQVFAPNGELRKETHYLRDEKGRVLADRVTEYLPKNSKKTSTAYLYGPRGLLGFFRNNKFYSVTTDHIGSIKLVITDGQVVVSYDYLPYGKLMRVHGNDPETHISYRYTGQEWDEETGLYNFHARLYDPSIGRFYQPDPRAQYFSPYKYAGNSPVSLVDPDGEFAFLLLFAPLFAVAGLYLGGAAANHRWNPADWDFKDPGTYIGMGGGALAGFFLPIGFTASVGAIGLGATVLLGTGGAYLTTAAVNQNWDPTKWQWDRPHTWNALFQGFGAGSGVAGGAKMAHNFANQVFGASKISRTLFLTVSYTVGAGTTYAAGVMANDGNFALWEWDWTNPATWSALVDGFDSGMGWPQGVLEVGRGLGKLAKNPKKFGSMLGKDASKWKKLKTILKNPKHPLYKTTGSVVMIYFMGSSANGELDITRWNLAAFSTYEGVLNGVFFGKDATAMLKFARSTKNKALNPVPALKKKSLKWSKKIVHQLDKIQIYRKGTEYNRIMEKYFSSEASFRKDNQPLFRKENIETFFKHGIEKWKTGESRVPDDLQHLLTNEVNENVQSSSKKLKDWKVEADQLSKKQREIFPEEDVKFLSCRRAGRRRRGGGGGSSCVVPDAADSNNKDTNAEIIDHLLSLEKISDTQSSDFILIQPKLNQESLGFDPNKPENFGEHLSLILDKTPNVLLGSKPDFFANFVFGSILTMPKSNAQLNGQQVYLKTDIISLSTPAQHKIMEPVLKTCFNVNKEGRSWLVLKTFVSETPELLKEFMKNEKHMQELNNNKKLRKELNDNEKLTSFEDYQNYFQKTVYSESKYTVAEIDDISKKLHLTGDFGIREEIFYQDTKNSVHMSQYEANKIDYSYKPSTPDNVGTNKFHKVEPVDHAILEEHLNKLHSNNIEVVKEGIQGFTVDLLTIFKNNKEILQLGENIPESRFHAFFYGALAMNFKHRHYLDLYVERVAGRGYADALLLSRKDGKRNKSWNGKPIIIEFKSDDTSATGAFNQAIGSGYLYNLGLRTVAEKAIIMGVNSKTSEVIAQEVNIPVTENLVDKIIANPNDKKGIENVLKDKYFSICPMAIKTQGRKNDHYLSRLIVGEMLAMDSTEKYVKFHTEGDFKDKLTTYFFKDPSEKWVMLNVVESSIKDVRSEDFWFKDVNLKELKYELPNVDVDTFTRIDIKVNSRSKSGWSKELPKRSEVDNNNNADSNNMKKEWFYYQNMDSTEIKTSNEKITINTENFVKLERINIDDIFSNYNDVDNVQVNTLLKNMDLSPLKEFINSESDFQAIFQGLLQYQIENQGVIIKSYPEANPSRAGRIDLVVSKLRKINNEVYEEHLSIMELKYATTLSQVNKKLMEAHDQLLKYKTNLKSFTDLGVYIPMAVVFNKGTGKIHYELYPASEISHSSDSEGSQQSIYNLKNQLQSSRNSRRKLDRKATDDGESFPKKFKPYESNRQKRYVRLPKIKKTVLPKNTDFTGDVQKVHTVTKASSGGSRLQFWPFNAAKKAGTTILSIVASLWTSAPAVEDSKPTSHPDQLFSEQQSFKPKEHVPSMLEMGDKWMQNTNLNSNLTFGVLLVRKLTGYRPPMPKANSADQGLDIELSIKSTTLVDEFLDMVMSHAQFSHLNASVCDVFDNTTIYYKAIKLVRLKLVNAEHLDEIPQLLYQKIVQANIKKIISQCTKKQVDAFLTNITNDLHQLQGKFNQLIEEWSIQEQCPEEKLASQSTSKAAIEENMAFEDLARNSRQTQVSQNLESCKYNTTNLLQ